MRRLLSCVGFLLLLCGCGRGVSDPAESAAGDASSTPAAQSSPAAQPSAVPGAPPPARLFKTSENLLKPDAFTPFEKGGQQQGEVYLCDNGSDAGMIRGIMQRVVLDQTKPEPVFAVAYSKAEGATGEADSHYSLSVNLVFTDGTFLPRQHADFAVGTHEWERREVYVMPEKPIREVYFYYLFRKHGGKAWFKKGEFYTVKPPEGDARVATNGPQPVELVGGPLPTAQVATATKPSGAATSTSATPVTKLLKTSENLFDPDSFTSYGDGGFERDGELLVCNNGADTNAARGVSQQIELNQTKPEPFFVRAYSKAESVTGSPNYDYALYLDIRYKPGELGAFQTASFNVGTHDWEFREIYVMPDKAVHDVSCHLLFRKHGGKAWFKEAQFYTVKAPDGTASVATNGPKPVELADSPSLAAVKRPPPVTRLVKASENLITPYSFDPMGQGFERQRETFFCDNSDDPKAYRGVQQSVELLQTKPEPVFAVAYSKAEGVKGLVNQEYSVFLDLQYADGTFTHWRFSAFDAGTHDWQRREVYFMPKKPINVVWYHVIFRNHAGKAWFRLPELYKVRPPEGGATVALNRPEPVTLIDGEFSELPALPASITTSGKPPISVAVMDFVDKGPSVELANLRTAMAEMLAGDLSQYEGLRVVERVRVEQLLGERNLQQGLTDQAATTQVGKALAADYLVSGTFAGKASAVTLEVSLSKTGDAKPVAEWKERIPLAKLAETEQQWVTKIVSGVGIAQPKRRAPPKPQPGPSPLVAVLAFRNLSPTTRLTAMEGGFADILQDNLSAVKDVRLVEREKLRAVLSEQKLSLSGLADPAMAVRVGRLLGAQRLVYGSFVELGEDLRLDVRLADSRSAAVLAAESAMGKSAEFAPLLEGLAVRLAADLAVQPDPDAAGRVKAATPTRSIEAAVHLADGDKAFAAGQYEAAAKAYERVLLADPKNLMVGMRRTRAWYLAKDHRRAVEAGEQTIAAGLSISTPSRASAFINARREFVTDLTRAYSVSGNDDGATALMRQVVDQCPDAWLVSWARETLAQRFLRDPDRVEEGAAMLRDAVDAARKKNDADAYSSALLALKIYYYFAAHGWSGSRPGSAAPRDDPEYQRRLAEKRLQWAKASDEVVEFALKAAEARRDDCWATWASIALNRAAANQDPQARYEMLHRVLLAFSWVSYIPWQVHVQLGTTCFELKRWDEALKSHRYLLEHPQTAAVTAVPDLYEIAHRPSGSGLDQQLRSLFYIGQIHQMHLKQPEEAERKYQEAVDRFGLVNNLGRPISAALHEMDKKPVIPAKIALVWGGRETAQKAWDDLLGPMGFKTHVVARYSVSEAHLAPYSLVVLARPGMIPYAPDDILALRSYVATGGSLLVIVSPGWEPSQPGNQNSLLWLFGVQADQDAEMRAGSTRIVPHAITESITSAMAKNAVNLKVPQGTGLIQAGNRTVLATFPYRQGRVVVASFGQWFLPTFSIDQVYRWPGHWTQELPRNTLPLESGQQRQLPLLVNVVRWLTEPRPDDEELQDRRKPFVEALAASMRVQFGIVPRETLKDPLKKLVAEAEAGVWKEEALWTAGEASLRWAFIGRGDALDYSMYDYFAKDGPPQPVAEYYDRLIKEFPQSPLRPLAQWRLADCRRRKAIADRYKELQRATYADQGESIPLFQKVDAPKGSYPWAWARLWIGSIHAANGRHGEAAPFFREVAEAMPAGPEKSMALVDLGYMLEFDKGRWEEAIRYHKAAKDAPNDSWQRLYYNGWGPLRADDWPITTHEIADRALAGLRRAAKK